MPNIGSRWQVGAAAPKLPQPMLDQIAHVEAELSAAERASKSWTLTWIENKPVARLDDGPSVNWYPELGQAYLSDVC